MTPTTPITDVPHSADQRAQWCGELTRHVPFAQMAPEHVTRFAEGATLANFEPGDVLLGPSELPAQALHFILEGSVTGGGGLADAAGSFEYSAGDLFPVGAVMGQRGVTATYVANEPTQCLLLSVDRVLALADDSPPFTEFLNRRLLHLLALSQRAAQAAWATQVLAEQSLEARLATLPARQPLACSADTPLSMALQQMHERRVGSVLVVDEAHRPTGILTRHDVLGRVTLPQRPLSTPIGEVMSTPVQTLTLDHTLQDAALTMSIHGVRHVPITHQQRLVNIVSERDLFALQRLSIKQLSLQIRAAGDGASLKRLAGDLRRFAGQLLGQGVQARQLTELISHLNDLLTERLLQLAAARRGMDLSQACWLAFGSEGRGEQTVATDQDNGLIFVSEQPDLDRPRWLALALEVNRSLDDCGYPLCQGQVMASNPACCLTAAEWCQRFERWMEHGAPDDLLNASIYFDLRPLAGNAGLARPLQDLLVDGAARVPRFLKQLAGNALRLRPPLNWRGALETQTEGGKSLLDLKLHGTAIFVDVARLLALSQRIQAVGTRARLGAAAQALHVPEHESEAWIAAFEFLQMLRLRLQLSGTVAANPNAVDVDTLNDIDRRMLKESVRMARRLQQRIELDYQR